MEMGLVVSCVLCCVVLGSLTCASPAGHYQPGAAGSRQRDQLTQFEEEKGHLDHVLQSVLNVLVHQWLPD